MQELAGKVEALAPTSRVWPCQDRANPRVVNAWRDVEDQVLREVKVECNRPGDAHFAGSQACWALEIAY